MSSIMTIIALMVLTAGFAGIGVMVMLDKWTGVKSVAVYSLFLLSFTNLMTLIEFLNGN